MTALQTIAQQTGGQSVSAGQDLAPALQRVSHDLNTYYIVTFASANGDDGHFHSVQFSSRRKGALVRARSGYWAPMPEIRSDAKPHARRSPSRCGRFGAAR